MNFSLFDCRRVLSSLSLKCEGRMCSRYFSWTKDGLISFRIDFWNFY